MAKKYIATLVRKYCLAENYFLFAPINVIKGDYDPDSNSFVTEEGAEFLPFQDPCFMFSEQEYFYANPVSFQSLKEKYSCEPYQEWLFHYMEENETKIYFATESDQEKGQILIKSFSLEDIFKEEGKKNKKPDMSKEVLLKMIETKQFTREELEKVKDALLITKEKKTSSSAQESAKVFVTSSPEILSSKEIKAKIKETVLAQDEAIDRIVTEIKRMEKGKKKGILLTGSTGVGKTEIMSQLAQYLNRPFKIVDSGQLTSPGYVGKDIEEELYELYANCNFDLEKTERAILYFDEIDKKGSESNQDIAGRAVLNLLLKFLDGTTYQAHQNKFSAKSIPIKTNNMLILAGGAFMDVYKKVSAKKDPVGFKMMAGTGKNREPEIEDFVKIGLMPEEFMGRFPIVIHLNDLKEKDLEEILRRGGKSPLKAEKEAFADLGVTLTIKDSYYQRAAQKAYELRTGARSLEGIVSNSTWRAYQEVEDHEDLYEEVILSAETIEDNHQYQVKKREKGKVLEKKKES